ncbi:hypothetical protein [Tsuneonella sp. SYSU-LHT278]|uniref:hypothetical protein n=1 Tax=Tsuneonella sediminis TaxID=3416089 RepID=UPI003F78DF41
MRNFTLVAGLGLLAAPVSTVSGADAGFSLGARVPVFCEVRQRGVVEDAISGSAVSLGKFLEYCNAPGGYRFVVRYAPGSLRGAVLTAGGDQVVLDGSGEAVLSRATGPRIRERAITATPGAAGFDTDHITFQLVSA